MSTLVTDSKSKSGKKYLVVIIIVAVIVVSSVVVYRFSDDIFGNSLGSDHQHARFKVFLEGQAFNFSPTKYPEYRKANDFIFLDKSDWVIHRFTPGATLETFFQSLGMEFNSSCFKLDDQPRTKFDRTDYCNDGDKTLKFYVNSELNEEYEKYVIMDNDLSLISYGDQTVKAINQQLGTLKSPPV